jgi:hypothetical protein
MARTKEWKLILNESRPPELYRMNGGWIELENIANDPAHAEILESLKNKIEETWKW